MKGRAVVLPKSVTNVSRFVPRHVPAVRLVHPHTAVGQAGGPKGQTHCQADRQTCRAEPSHPPASFSAGCDTGRSRRWRGCRAGRAADARTGCFRACGVVLLLAGRDNFEVHESAPRCVPDAAAPGKKFRSSVRAPWRIARSTGGVCRWFGQGRATTPEGCHPFDTASCHEPPSSPLARRAPHPVRVRCPT